MVFLRLFASCSVSINIKMWDTFSLASPDTQSEIQQIQQFSWREAEKNYIINDHILKENFAKMDEIFTKIGSKISKKVHRNSWKFWTNLVRSYLRISFKENFFGNPNPNNPNKNTNLINPINISVCLYLTASVQ